VYDLYSHLSGLCYVALEGFEVAVIVDRKGRKASRKAKSSMSRGIIEIADNCRDNKQYNANN